MIIEKKVTLIKDIETDKGVVIGSEGCIYRAFDQNNLAIATYCANNNIQIRYVTPMIPEFYLDEAIVFIKKLVAIAESVTLKITFNDIGLFYSCLPFVNHFIPVIGRIISRSIVDCPWYKELLINESDKVKKALAGYTFYHEAKKSMFSNWKVREVELNVASINCMKEILKQNLIITVYSDNKLISTSRVCYSSMIKEYTINNGCIFRVCNDKIPFCLDKIWDKKSRMRMMASLKAKDFYSDMYIQGTQVFSTVTKNDIEELVKQKCIHNLII